MAEIRGTVRFGGDAAPKSDDEAYATIHRFAADAVFGSFGDFSPDYFRDDMWETAPKKLLSLEVDSGADGSLAFAVGFPDDLLGPTGGAYQHLVGILAGDVFDGQIPGLTARWSIVDVSLSGKLRSAIDSEFGGPVSHSADSVREAFGLEDYEPLLAFSLKPRFGLTRDAVKDLVLGVLGAGFHIVEFDTRCLSTIEGDVGFLGDLAERAAVAVPERTTRLSLNVSGPTALAEPVLEALRRAHDPPYVLKVDGGLDGISALQHVRRTQDAVGWRPILTCYPLLRRALEGRVPPQLFVEALTHSGADIIYPGGRPSFTEGIRNLWAEEPDNLIRAVSRYHELCRAGRPMPTIAGGVYLGEVHAYLDILGPNVPLFLGGAIALHREGPIEGARLCRKVVDAVVDARVRDPGAAATPDLSDKLTAAIEGAYASSENHPDQFRYVSPTQILKQTKHLKSWFGR
ncbi:MAG: hypothetical protein AMXMBFR53_07040 [Gemmatimonadota bacterium]